MVCGNVLIPPYHFRMTFNGKINKRSSDDRRTTTRDVRTSSYVVDDVRRTYDESYDDVRRTYVVVRTTCDASATYDDVRRPASSLDDGRRTYVVLLRRAAMSQSEQFSAPFGVAYAKPGFFMVRARARERTGRVTIHKYRARE